MAAEIIRFPFLLARRRATEIPAGSPPADIIELPKWKAENSQEALVARRAMRMSAIKLHNSDRSDNFDANDTPFSIYKTETGFQIEQTLFPIGEIILYDINPTGIELRSRMINPEGNAGMSGPITLDVFSARKVVTMIRRSVPVNRSAKPKGS